MKKALGVSIILVCWKVSYALKTTTCADTEAAEGSGFGRQFEFSDTCDSVCSYDTCPIGASSCQSTALDGTCGTHASCGANGCECDPRNDVASRVAPANFEADANVDVLCESDKITIRFDKCAANAYGVFLEHMFMDGPAESTGTSLQTDADNTCTGRVAFYDNRMVYEFVIMGDMSACNTENTKDSGDVVWKNAVQGMVLSTDGVITRDQFIHVDFICTFSQTLMETLADALNPLIAVVKTNPVGDMGTVTITMGLWSDSTYMTPVATGAMYAVGHQLFAGITTDFRDSNSALVILDAYATASSDPDDANNFALIINGCPTNNLVSLVKNGVDHEVRFSFLFFYFVSEALAAQDIYIHVNVLICTKSDPDCPKDCSGSGRKRSVGPSPQTISLGPIGIYGKPQSQHKKENLAVNVTASTTVAVEPMEVKNVKQTVGDSSVWTGFTTTSLPVVIVCFAVLLVLVLCSYCDASILKLRFRNMASKETPA